MYGDRVQFIDVLIRNAHPGERDGTYRTYEDKLEDARAYKRDDGLPWPVLVDDLEGSVHHATYGRMADPTYLIDADGVVAFYNMWTHPPTLQQAIEELLARGGRGAPVAGGLDRTPHILASFVAGWHAVKRGGKRGLWDYGISVPGSTPMTYAGHVAKPVLAPVALRATPLPTAARVALAAIPVALIALIVWLVAA
jgi:hypothetical protein